MLRTAVILKSEEAASTRYRILLNVEAFERGGVDVYPMLLPRTTRGKRKLFEDISGFDLVVVQRRLIQPWLVRDLRRHARVLAYDFDDAVVYKSAPARGFRNWSRRMKFRSIIKAADFATAGNSYLAGLSGLDDDRVFIIPTPVDTERYSPDARQRGPGAQPPAAGSATAARRTGREGPQPGAPPAEESPEGDPPTGREEPSAPGGEDRRPGNAEAAANARGGSKSAPVRIGWVGQATTVKYLEGVMGALDRLAARRDDFELAVVSDGFPRPRRDYVREIEWTPDGEPGEVASFDIGLGPLPDNPWTRGKCSFKLILYGASGVPAVASPVGINNDIVSEGENGLFARDLGEWEGRIRELLDDAEARRRMGEAARRRIEENYSTKAVIPRWAEILKTCARRFARE